MSRGKPKANPLFGRTLQHRHWVNKFLIPLQLFLVLPMALEAAQISQLRSEKPRLTNRGGRHPLSDYQGKIKHLLIQFNDLDPLPAYYDLLRKLDPEVRVTILVPNPGKKELLQQLLRHWQVPNLKRFDDRVVNASLTPWARDPFVVLRGDDGAIAFLFRKTWPSLRGGGDDPVLKKHLPLLPLAGHVPQIVAAPFVLDGGNLLSAGNEVLVGNNAYFDNLAQELPSQEKYAARMGQTLGAAVAFVGGHFIEVPWGHSDMYLTLIGRREILVGDPAWGARLLEREIKNGLKDYRRVYFDEQHLPLSAHARAMIFSDPLFIAQIKEALARQTAEAAHLLSDLMERNSDKVLHRAFEQLTEELLKRGFVVHRLPLLLNARRGFSPILTYNNVLLEESAGEKRVYLPNYGLPELDQAASAVYKKLGFRLRKIDGRNASFLLGSVRCLTNVLERSDG